MKKVYLFLMFALLMVGVSSCKCSSDQKEDAVVPEQTDTTAVAEPVVENVISTDKEAMYLNYAEDYRWFETGVVLKDWLDEENDGSVSMIVNVFQAVEEKESGSFDTFVVKYQHSGTDVYEEAVHGFWVEDLPLNDENIKITFKEAYDKVMAVNLPKPHTKQVVLRKQIGPKACNPQWIFGNLKAQIYVDATTGEVSDKNPAFEGLEKVNVEWP